MTTFLCAWELGGGLGHAASLQALAAALTARGQRCVLALRDLVQTATLLQDLAAERVPAPVWTFRTVGLPDPPASLAEILLAQGYLRPEHLQAQVQGWLGLMRLAGAQAVICDYAPTAVLAARVLGLPCATLGNGFYMPPDVQPLPPFREGEDVDGGRIAQAESRVLRNVNAVLAHFRRPPLARLAQLYAGDLPLLCAWPEIDHSGSLRRPAAQRWYGPGFAPESGVAPAWPPGAGPQVFAYLKGAHPDHAAALRALADAGCRTLCYLPEVAAGKAPPVVSALIEYAAAPVAVAAALPGCRFVVCHASSGLVAQSLLAGVPVLMLPLQAEQRQLARHVAAGGYGIDADHWPQGWPAAVQALRQAGPYTTKAREFAARHAGHSREVQTAALCDAIEGLLRGAAVA